EGATLAAGPELGLPPAPTPNKDGPGNRCKHLRGSVDPIGASFSTTAGDRARGLGVLDRSGNGATVCNGPNSESGSTPVAPTGRTFAPRPTVAEMTRRD